MRPPDPFSIQPYTPKELARLYRCSAKTLWTWLKHLKSKLGPRRGHFYNQRQVRLIVEQLGTP